MVRSIQLGTLMAVYMVAAITYASSAAGQGPAKRTISDINLGVYRHETRLTAGIRFSDRQLSSIDSLNTIYEPAFRDAARNVHPGMTPVEKAQFRAIIGRLMADRERDFRSLLSSNQRTRFNMNKAAIAATPRRLRAVIGVGPRAQTRP